MATIVENEQHWCGGLDLLHGVSGNYNSPNHLFQHYSCSGVSMAPGGTVPPESSSNGDYQVQPQELMTSPQSVYQALEMLGESSVALALG